jgi:hypothetical protein
MDIIKKNWGKIIPIIFTSLLPVISFAQITITPSETSGKISNPLGKGVNSIPTFIRILLEGLLRIGIPVAALALIYCGFLFVIARGNSEKINTAKEALLYTCVGCGVLLGAWGFATIISNTVQSLS